VPSKIKNITGGSYEQKHHPAVFSHSGAGGRDCCERLANALPLNGLKTGEISDRFTVYFVPAGYVFSIWGLIYLALIGYAVFQVLPSQRNNPRLQAIGYWFVLSCGANVVWLFLWHYEQFYWTLPAMLALLACLIVIYLRLDIGRSHPSTGERWLVEVPFSIYLGWITVATVANVTQLLYYLGWGGWGLPPESWFVLVLATVLVIAGLMAYTRRDVAYLLVLVWALAGIAVKHAAVPLVTISTWIVTLMVLVFVIYSVFENHKRVLPDSAR
jgi:hypothetical protein